MVNFQKVYWEDKTLSSLGFLGRGKSKHRPRNDPRLYDGNYPFVQTSDIKHANFYVNSYSQTYNEVGLKQSKLWQKDTLCMTIAANIAETALLSFPACFPDSIVGFVADPEKSNVKFVKYALDLAKKSFQNRAQGAAQDNLSLEKIDNLKIRVPDPKTQTRIASILSAYDDLIENNEKRIKALEEMAQLLYTDWFVNFNFPVHLCHPGLVEGSSQLIGYKDAGGKLVDSGTEYGMIPEGWEVVPISKLAEFMNGHPFKPNQLGEEGLPVVKIPELRSGILDKTPRNSGNGINKKYVINTGEILFSWSATLLVNIWNSGEALLNQHLFKVTPKDINYRAYTFYTLVSLVEKIRKHVVGATMQHLRKGTVESSKVLLPNIELLMAYEKKASKFLDEIGLLYRRNQSLSITRDLLIPQLVTGKREIE